MSAPSQSSAPSGGPGGYAGLSERTLIRLAETVDIFDRASMGEGAIAELARIASQSTSMRNKMRASIALLRFRVDAQSMISAQETPPLPPQVIINVGPVPPARFDEPAPAPAPLPPHASNGHGSNGTTNGSAKP